MNRLKKNCCLICNNFKYLGSRDRAGDSKSTANEAVGGRF